VFSLFPPETSGSQPGGDLPKDKVLGSISNVAWSPIRRNKMSVYMDTPAPPTSTKSAIIMILYIYIYVMPYRGVSCVTEHTWVKWRKRVISNSTPELNVQGTYSHTNIHSIYSGTSLTGLSELRTQYKKPPY